MKNRRFLVIVLLISLWTIVASAADVQIIAHRGFSAKAPENTLAAFQAAADLGVGFELDVTLSATGEVIVIHDDSVDRTTDGEGAVNQLSLDYIKSLDAGSWFDDTFAGEKIPTLQEVLSRLGGVVLIDIEIKSLKPREPLADAVVAEIEKASLVDKVLVTSFDPYMLTRVREKNPDIRRGMLTGTFKGEDLTIIEKFILRRLLFRGKVKPVAIVMEDVRASKAVIRKWQRRGYEFLVWTVNEEAEMRRLIEASVDGIITNYPDVLQEILAK